MPNDTRRAPAQRRSIRKAAPPLAMALLGALLLSTAARGESPATPADGVPGAYTFDSAPAEPTTAPANSQRSLDPIVRVDAADVTSMQYAAQLGYEKPLEVTAAELDDQAWSTSPGVAGQVLVDRARGRVRFFAGDEKPRLQRVGFLEMPHGLPRQPTALGRFAWVPNGESQLGLQVVDASDVNNPRRAAHFDVGNFGRESALDGNRLYVLTTYNGVSIFEINEAGQTRPLGRWRLPAPVNHGDRLIAFSAGGKRYFYCQSRLEKEWKHWPGIDEKKPPPSNLHLVDATDPANPTSVPAGYEAVPFLVRNGAAYFIGGPSLRSADLGNPQSPRVTDEIKITGNFIAITADDNVLLAVTDQRLLMTYDLSDPLKPRKLGQVEVPGIVQVSAIGRAADKVVYVVGNGRPDNPLGAALAVVDLTQPASPKVVTTLKLTGNQFYGVTVSDDRGFLSDADNGLWLLDTRDPRAPTLGGLFECAGDSHQLLVDGRRGVLNLVWGASVALLDLADPTQPRVTRVYRPNRFFDFVDTLLDHQLLFIQGPHRRVVDVYDPRRPVVVGRFMPIPGGTSRTPLVRWGRRAFAVGEVDGLPVVSAVDLSEPITPKVTAMLALTEPRRFYSAVSDGQTLFLAGARIIVPIDVRDPARLKLGQPVQDPALNPNLLGWDARGGKRMAAARGYLYLLSGDEKADDPRIVVFDARDPMNLKRLYTTPAVPPNFQEDWYDNQLVHQPDTWTDVVVRGRYLYVADYWGGLRIFDLEDPAKPRLIASEFDPYLAIAPPQWSRESYLRGIQNGKVDPGKDFNTTLGLSAANWERRREISRAITGPHTTGDLLYAPGFDLHAWCVGDIVAGYLLQPKLMGLVVFKVPLASEVPAGKVTVE